MHGLTNLNNGICYLVKCFAVLFMTWIDGRSVAKAHSTTVRCRMLTETNHREQNIPCEANRVSVGQAISRSL